MVNAKYDRAKRHYVRKVRNVEMVLHAHPDETSYNLIGHSLRDLKEMFEGVESLIVGLGDEAEEEDLVDFEKLENDFTEMCLELDKRLVAKEKAEKDEVTQNRDAMQVQPKVDTHLKRMEVPKFDGTVRGYLTFRKMFKLIVSDKGQDEIALIRLRQECLKKDSPEYFIVKSKQTLGDAFLALDEKFLRTSIVKDSILRDLKDIAAVKKKTDAIGLRNLVTMVTAAHQDLSACDRDASLGETAFAHLMAKLPRTMAREVDEKILECNLDSAGALSFLVELCEKEASINEQAEIRSAAHAVQRLDLNPNPKHGQGSRGFGAGKCSCTSHGVEGVQESSEDESSDGGQCLVVKSKLGKPQKCILHPEMTSHSTMKCHEFLQKKSSMEKKELLVKHNRCLKCFGEHSTQECRGDIQCLEPNCKTPDHSSLLHGACLVLELECEAGSCREQIQEFLGLNTVRPGHTALMSTKNRHKKVPLGRCNVLYDSCATMSQVMNSMADQCGLVPVNSIKNFRVKTAGRVNAEDWGPSRLFNVPLYDETGALVFTVKCVGVDFIGHTDNYVTSAVAKEFEDDGLKSGDVLAPASGVIHVLIGNNHPEFHPERVATKGKLIWAKSKFGPVLHGSHPKFPNQTVSDDVKGMSVVVDSTCANMCTISMEPVLFIQNSDFIVNDPGIFTLKARSGEIPASDTEEVLDIKNDPYLSRDILKDVPEPHCSDLDSPGPVCSVCSTKIADAAAFERWCSVEEQTTCSLCKKCLSDNTRLTPEDQRRIKIYKDCLRYEPDLKRFVAKMPWIEDYSKIPDNYPTALRRLLSLCKSIARDDTIKACYKEEFRKMIDASVLMEVSPEEDRLWREQGGKVWYVTHFYVMNSSSASTPMRVILDPTVSFRGIVINDMFEAPPNLIPQIPSLVLKFRERAIPIAMDISKAYWSVYLETQESHLHRVVWNDLDPTQEPKIYRMLRNSWGSKPAGSIFSIAMHTLGERYRKEFPHVYEFLVNQLYVDDGTYSVDTIEEAYRLARDTCFVLEQGSFMVKFFIIGGHYVNVSELSTEHDSEDSLPPQVRLGGYHERVLGLSWHPMEDEISLVSSINFSKKRRGARVEPDVLEEEFDRKFPEKFTLRMYLSVIASLYDVCGLGSPVSIMLKHELGRIFQIGVGWDEPLPGDSEDDTPSRGRCKELIKMLYGLSKVRFDRCLRPQEVEPSACPTLVTFADSSQTAYGATSYINWPTPDGPRVSRLVLAKAKPFPKKAPLLTIPRGEMMGMVIGVRLKNTILRELSYDFENCVFLTDSTIALGQIGMDASKFKTWMAGRVEEISNNSSLDSWFHVDSRANVADDVTRGLDTRDMDKTSRWQNGPSFLQLPTEEWPMVKGSEVSKGVKTPVEMRLKDPRMELPKAATVLTLETVGSQPMVKFLQTLNFSPLDASDSWLKVQRRTARVVQFCELLTTKRETLLARLRSPDIKRTIETLKQANTESRKSWVSENDKYCPSPDQMKVSRQFWIAQAQESLPTNVDRRINPTLCDDGLVRALGRTSSANHRPVVIPGDSPLAQILLRHYHSPCHLAADSTLALLRKDYWLINGQKKANSFVAKCSLCNKVKKRTPTVEMAPMREEQFTRYPAFSAVSLDLAGPYLTVADRRSTRSNPALSGKVWVVVIVCVSSRAVHLELTEGYDTASFLAAYDAFTQIRGKPRKVTCDLGSQLVGAANTLVKLWDCVDRYKVANHEVLDTQFEFIPSGAHSSLGVAERMVKMFKTAMEVAVQSRKPKFTKLEMSRVLYGVANIINDRPLAIGRCNVAKLDADRLIRPNDLILGRSTADITPLIPSDDVSVKGKSEYTELLRLKAGFLNAFWSKFYDQVFKTLFPREKWFTTKRQIQLDDIVLIRDPNPVRGLWSWGEICDVHPSRDGIIRTVVVRYKISPDVDGRSKNFKPSRSGTVRKSVRDLAVILRSEDR